MRVCVSYAARVFTELFAPRESYITYATDPTKYPVNDKRTRDRCVCVCVACSFSTGLVHGLSPTPTSSTTTGGGTSCISWSLPCFYGTRVLFTLGSALFPKTCAFSRESTAMTAFYKVGYIASRPLSKKLSGMSESTSRSLTDYKIIDEFGLGEF